MSDEGELDFSYSPQYDDGYQGLDDVSVGWIVHLFMPTAAVAAALAVLMLLTCCSYVCKPCTACLKATCCRCCRSSKEKTFKSYEKRHVLVMRVCLAVFGFIAFVGICVGWDADREFADAISDLSGAIIDFSDTFVKSTIVIAEELQAVEEQTNPENQSELSVMLDNFIEESSNAIDTASDARQDIVDGDSSRSDVLVAFFILPLIVMVFIIGTVLASGRGSNPGSKSCILSCFVPMFAFSSFLIWLTVAIHFPMSKGIDDACIEISAFLQGDDGATGIVVCPKKPFAEVTETSVEGLNLQLQAIEEGTDERIEPVPSELYQEDDIDFDGIALEVARIDAELEALDTSALIAEAVAFSRSYIVILEQILFLTDCSLFESFLQQIFRLVCSDLIDSVLQVVDAGITVGSGLLLLMVLYAICVSIYGHELYVDAITFRKPAVADGGGENGADDVEMASGAGPAGPSEDNQRDKLGEVQASASGPGDVDDGDTSNNDPEDGDGEKWADAAPSAPPLHM